MSAIDFNFKSDFVSALNSKYKNKNRIMPENFAGFQTSPIHTFADGGLLANPDGLMFTEDEVANIVRANTNKGRKKRIEEAKENKKSYKGLLPQSNGTLFAIGGDLQSHSADWSTGLTHINAGGSHEESPYDGVQIGTDSEGTPNLVEEGECIYDDYVFSNRIELDAEAKEALHFPKKSELTYAEAAKKLEKEISERPNDAISMAGFKAQMEQLEEQQERQKQEMEAERAKEAFEALSPEEQTALMQQKAQQDAMEEEAAQEQAMAEAQAAQGQLSPEEMAAMGQQKAAMAQQQMSPEEAAMMQQQMAAQQGGMPVEGMAPEGYAYGGELDKEINIFDLGGLAWIKKNHPEVKNPEAVAKALEKMMQANRSNYYRPSSTGTSGGLGNYEWQFEDAWTEMVPATTSLSAAKNHFDKWLKYGLDRENAFNVTHSNKLYTQYMGEAQKAHKRDYDNQYNELVKKYAEEERLKAEKQKKISAAVDEYFKNPQEFLARYNPNYIREVQQAAQEQAKQQANGSTVPSGGTKALSQDKYSVPENTVVNPLANVTSKYKLVAPEDQYKVENGQVKFWRVGNVAYPTEEAARNALKGSKKADAQISAKKAVTEESTKVAQQATASTGKKVDDTFEFDSKNIDWDTFSDVVSGYRPSLEAGRVLGNYRPDDAFSFGEYGDIKGLETSPEYRAFTEYVKNNPNDPQVQEYLKALDAGTHEGVEKLFKDGKLKDNWADLYNKRRTDHIAGIYHLNPFSAIDTAEIVADTPEAIAAAQAAVDADNATLQEAATRAAAGDPEAAWDYGDPTVQANVAKGLNPDGTKPEVYGTSDTQAIPPVARKIVPNLKKETYYGLFGAGIPLLMQLAGVGKPDMSGMDRVLANAARNYHLANNKYLGNYLKYRPMDVWFEQAKMDALSRGTDRSILNSGANQGSLMAGLLSNGYNSQLASGELYRKAQEYNNQDELARAQFNRATDQYNADAYNQLSKFNANVMNQTGQQLAQLGLQAELAKDDANRWWASNLYGNVNAITDRVNQWEKWKRDHNTIAKMVADGIFGNLSGRQFTGQGFVSEAAEGGKVKRRKGKKKKRGLFI